MKLLLGLLLLPIFAAAAEGIQVHAIVDRNQVGQGDVINLTVAVSAQDSVNVGSPRLPALKGFDLINTSSGVETRSTFVNGRFQTSQTRNFNYMLAVTEKGVLNIPPIPVIVDGKTYNTQEIKVSATGQRSNPQNQAQRQRQQQPNSPFKDMDEMEELFNQMLQRRMAPNAQGGQPGTQGGNQNIQVNAEDAFFIHVETDKTKAYVGEQITTSFYIYTRGQVRDIDTLKYPDLKGFWKEELEMATRLNFEQVVVNGIPYQRALLVSYALFPIKAGKSNVDSYRAKCTVLTASSFGFGQPVQFTKASKPIPIEVLDVPAEGRPENFSGAVGNYRMGAAFEPASGTVGQPVKLRVRFEGHGNAKLIELPKLELPPTLEIYDQKSSARYLKDGTSFKEFEILLIPREGGVFNINPVSISMFDPATKKYTAIASQALTLTVTGTGAQTQAAAQTGTATKPPEDTGPKLPALSLEMDSSALGGLQGGITLLAYTLVFSLLGWRGWTNLRRKPKKLSLTLVMNRRLKTVREFAAKKDWRRVGVELTNGIYYVLGQISEQGGANRELSVVLEHTPPSLRAELATPIEKLISQCEALSFAPEKMVGEMNSQDKLDKLINEFETVMKRAIELAEF